MRTHRFLVAFALAAGLGAAGEVSAQTSGGIFPTASPASLPATTQLLQSSQPTPGISMPRFNLYWQGPGGTSKDLPAIQGTDYLKPFGYQRPYRTNTRWWWPW